MMGAVGYYALLGDASTTTSCVRRMGGGGAGVDPRVAERNLPRSASRDAAMELSCARAWLCSRR